MCIHIANFFLAVLRLRLYVDEKYRPILIGSKVRDIEILLAFKLLSNILLLGSHLSKLEHASLLRVEIASNNALCMVVCIEKVFLDRLELWALEALHVQVCHKKLIWF